MFIRVAEIIGQSIGNGPVQIDAIIEIIIALIVRYIAGINIEQPDT